MLKEIFHKKLFFINDQFVKYESRLKLVISWFCYHESLYNETFFFFLYTAGNHVNKNERVQVLCLLRVIFFLILLTLNSFCMEVII